MTRRANVFFSGTMSLDGVDPARIEIVQLPAPASARVTHLPSKVVRP